VLVITDSAGYNVTYTYSLEVNQDPPLKVIGVKEVLDVNMPLNLFLFASLGFNFSLFLSQKSSLSKRNRGYSTGYI
jgi:hypothetical protein